MSTQSVTPVIVDAAIFIGSTRQYTSIDVVVDGDVLRLYRNRKELDSYDIVGTVETAGNARGQAAWDVVAEAPDAAPIRVQAVHGCGCGGRPKVKPNTPYGLSL